METFINNLLMYIVMYTKVNELKKVPLACWTKMERVYAWTPFGQHPVIAPRVEECKISPDGSTLTFTTKDKVQRQNQYNRKVFWSWNTTTTGIKVRENGTLFMWRKNFDGREFFVSAAGHHIYSAFIAERTEPWAHIVQQFCEIHGATSITNLVAPLADELGLNIKDLSAWQMNLMAGNITDMWNKLQKSVKFTKDERKLMLEAITDDFTYLMVARIAGRVKIPNLRDLDWDAGEVGNTPYTGRACFEFGAQGADMIASALRAVAPHRRLMLLGYLVGIERGYAVYPNDITRMLDQARRAGAIPVPLNFRTPHEYHNAAAALVRDIQAANEEISASKVAHIDGAMINDSIEVVVPKDTDTVRAWGQEQNHCIGSYADLMAAGRTILLGFKRDNKWVGHCSISRGRLEQLLGKHNRELPIDDHKAIIKFLKKEEIIHGRF